MSQRKGDEYRLHDVCIRIGSLYISNRDQGCILLDVGVISLFNCSLNISHPLLSQIRSVFYSAGKQVSTVYNELLMRNNFSQQSFSFAELGRLYAHIIPCFTSLSIVCEGVMVFEEVVVILQLYPSY